jgi:hypothetical protein
MQQLLLFFFLSESTTKAKQKHSTHKKNWNYTSWSTYCKDNQFSNKVESSNKIELLTTSNIPYFENKQKNACKCGNHNTTQHQRHAKSNEEDDTHIK